MKWVDNLSQSKSSLRNCNSRWPNSMNVDPRPKWPLVMLSTHGQQPLCQKPTAIVTSSRGYQISLQFVAEIIESEFSTLALSGGCPQNTLPPTTLVDSTCPSGSGTHYAGDRYRTRKTFGCSRANPSTHHSTSSRCLCFGSSTTRPRKVFG